MKKFSEKVSNDKICNCTAIPCILLIGYHLVPKYSESLAVPPPISQFGETAKKFSSPAKLCAKFPPMLSFTISINFSYICISQGSVVTQINCGFIFYYPLCCQFFTSCASKRIFLNRLIFGEDMAKVWWHVVTAHSAKWPLNARSVGHLFFKVICFGFSGKIVRRYVS